MSRELDKLLADAAYMTRKWDESVARRRRLTEPSIPAYESEFHRKSHDKHISRQKPRTKAIQRAKQARQIKPALETKSAIVDKSHEDEYVDIEEFDVAEKILSIQSPTKQKKLMDLVDAAHYMSMKMDQRKSSTNGGNMPIRAGKRQLETDDSELETVVAKKIYFGENEPSTPYQPSAEVAQRL